MDSYFVFLDKPAGISSQNCLTQFKKKYAVKKLGHHGTLDPFATGLLLVGVNEATKFFQFLDDSQKTYCAKICLGTKTDTLDCTGSVLETGPVPVFSKDQIQEVLSRFTGKMKQEPPMYSAVKVGGKKLYELAREGKDVQRKSRDIEIFELELVEYSSPYLTIVVTVSRGTYIRVLAEQIAQKLGVLGHLNHLVRTRLNQIDIAAAHSLSCETIPEDRKTSIDRLLSHYDTVELTPQQVERLSHGKQIDETVQNSVVKTQDEVKTLFLKALFKSQFLGMLERASDGLKPARLMSTEILKQALTA